MLYLFDELYTYLLATTLIGIFFVVKDRKIPKHFVLIIVFILTWRAFSKENSSRYYLFPAYLCIYLSVYAATRIKKKCIRVCLFLALMTIHVVKIYSPFNNIYIRDLQDILKKLSREDETCRIAIYKKEFYRASNGLTERPENFMNYLDTDNVSSVTDYYIDNLLFYRNLYLVTSESVRDSSEINEKKKTSRLCKPIASFLSNSSHSKNVVLYKHRQYAPVPPDIDLDDGNLVLKAYIKEYDTYIYQDGRELMWLVGKEISKKTGIIYRLYTTRYDLLPESRKGHKFDSRGFRIGSAFQKESIGHYLCFRREIPHEYPIDYIICGFSSQDSSVLTKRISLSE